MDTDNTPITCTVTHYSTLYRVGYWSSLDAKYVRTYEQYDGHAVVTYDVTYVLIGPLGDAIEVGSRYFQQFDVDDPKVLNDTMWFPDIETAIRHEATELMKLTLIPERWDSHPSPHNMRDGKVHTAFEAA